MVLRVTIFSDYICPFCYVGDGMVKKLVEESGIPLEITWRPYELHPDTPSTGIALTEYFGAEPARLAQMYDRLSYMAQAYNLPLTPPTMIANSHQALLLAEYARDKGSFAEVHQRLYAAYFHEGKNIARPSILADIAQNSGLDPDEALSAMRAPHYEARLAENRAAAEGYKVTGTPTFIIEDRYRIVGVQPYERVRDALSRLWNAQTSSVTP